VKVRLDEGRIVVRLGERVVGFTERGIC